MPPELEIAKCYILLLRYVNSALRNGVISLVAPKRAHYLETVGFGQSVLLSLRFISAAYRGVRQGCRSRSMLLTPAEGAPGKTGRKRSRKRAKGPESPLRRLRPSQRPLQAGGRTTPALRRGPGRRSAPFRRAAASFPPGGAAPLASHLPLAPNPPPSGRNHVSELGGGIREVRRPVSNSCSASEPVERLKRH